MEYSYKETHYAGKFSETAFDIILAGKTNTSKWWLDEQGQNWWNGKFLFNFNIIYYVLQGQFQIMFDSTWHTVSDGQLIYIPAGAQFEVRTVDGKPLEKYYLHFNIALGHLPVVSSLTEANIVSVGESQKLKEHFDTICHSIIAKHTDIFQTHAAGLHIINEFWKRTALEYTPESAQTKDPIEKAMQFITLNFRKQLSVESLASQFGLSRDYFSRQFSARYGCSPIRYITKLRIQAAEALLTTTNHSITDIAESVGFSDSSYFSRLFKNTTGIYPQRFRMLSKSTENEMNPASETE